MNNFILLYQPLVGAKGLTVQGQYQAYFLNPIELSGCSVLACLAERS